ILSAAADAWLVRHPVPQVLPIGVNPLNHHAADLLTAKLLAGRDRLPGPRREANIVDVADEHPGRAGVLGGDRVTDPVGPQAITLVVRPVVSVDGYVISRVDLDMRRAVVRNQVQVDMAQLLPV